jgi:hypothetical protein
MTLKAPRWSPAMSLFWYGYMAAMDVALSLFWAALPTIAWGFIFTLLESRGIISRRLAHDKTFLLGSLGAVFAVSFLALFRYFVAPDWGIADRLREVAARLEVGLASRANGVAIEWIGARFTSGGDVLSNLVGRCWVLSSPSLASTLLVVAHVPRALRSSRRGETAQREQMVVALYRNVHEGEPPLPAAAADQLAALGFKTVRLPEGLYVYDEKRCGRRYHRRALDLIPIERLVELWKICAATPAPFNRSF